MLFAPPPVPIPFPIHVVDPPGMAGWLIAVISGAVGFVLAIVAEPLKGYVMETVAARKVKPILYTELASWVTNLYRANKGKTKDKFHHVLRNHPDFSKMDWYALHHLNLVLRIDPRCELLKMQTMFRGIWESAGEEQDELTAGVVLCATVKTTLDIMGKLGAIDAKLIDSSIAAEMAERDRRENFVKK